MGGISLSSLLGGLNPFKADGSYEFADFKLQLLQRLTPNTEYAENVNHVSDNRNSISGSFCDTDIISH